MCKRSIKIIVFVLFNCTECSSRCLFLTSGLTVPNLPSYLGIMSFMRRCRNQTKPNNAMRRDVTRASVSSTHINHATQSLIDIDADTELLNGIMGSGHTNQGDVAWNDHIGNVEATESNQLFQSRAALEDTSNDSGVNPVAETDVDVLEQRIRLSTIEDVDESAELNVAT